MSTSKRIDQICIGALIFVLILTTLFINAEKLGVQAVSAPVGYETRLFNTSRVHSIDIVIDDWDSFIENCTDETYETCAVVIDGEAYKNVAIRAKGNTSLSSVESYGNNRYSFKIEFDHYDKTKSYHGLDKLCLNNIIQDNTYMKDYLVYQMMKANGSYAPLCSYAYITVNGEDWGLYLAVEAVEDAFLQRNYGNDYGELYKPDSSSMGGGKGNGRHFEMPEDFDGLDEVDDEMPEMSDEFNGEMPAMPEMSEEFSGEMPEMPNGFNGEMPDNFDRHMNGGNRRPDGDNENDQSENNTEQRMPGGDNENRMPDGDNEDRMPDGGGDPGGGGGMNGMMGSSDVLLQYSDDEFDSYSNIFDNAKTDITDSDKSRLISLLKQLNEGENIDSIVNTEEVVRYFVVHNFVLNFDSYTGSMIHNYYLYEEDGQLSLIPWDYNLAFSGFTSNADATSIVNYPIDTPVSGGTIDSRPMLAWIFNNEEYTELYHQYFTEFISEYFDSGYFSEMIDSVSEMISPYVEKDPTKFCTYEEFEAGASTLKEFCLLRAQSVSAQLDGTIPSTSDGQTQDSSSFINADDIDISSMGSMNMGNEHGMGHDGFDKNMPGSREHSNSQKPMDFPGQSGSSNSAENSDIPDFPADTLSN